MTPIVQALSREQFVRGDFRVRPGAVAIRIGDPCTSFVDVDLGFHSEHRFEFADVESPADRCWDGAMTPEQAVELVQILRQAVAEQRDVVVHCNRGESRSVAVAFAAWVFLPVLSEAPRRGNGHVFSALRDVFVSPPL